MIEGKRGSFTGCGDVFHGYFVLSGEQLPISAVILDNHEAELFSGCVLLDESALLKRAHRVGIWHIGLCQKSPPIFT
jgi:hypothetical protein